MSKAYRDAVNFAISLPADTAQAATVGQVSGEAYIEWWKEEDVLEVTFDGDDEYRYARRRMGRYIDEFIVAKVGELPADLLNYLAEMRV